MKRTTSEREREREKGTSTQYIMRNLEVLLYVAGQNQRKHIKSKQSGAKVRVYVDWTRAKTTHTGTHH